MIAEPHRTPQTKIKVRSAHVCIRYMRYAVQVATETERTAYYPQEKNRMKKKKEQKRKREYSRPLSHVCNYCNTVIPCGIAWVMANIQNIRTSCF